jgi:hypothetical protein
MKSRYIKLALYLILTYCTYRADGNAIAVLAACCVGMCLGVILTREDMEAAAEQKQVNHWLMASMDNRLRISMEGTPEYIKKRFHSRNITKRF